MKKIVALLLVLMVFMAGFSALAETFTAEAPGFGGSISVSVAVEDGMITGVDIAGDQETPAIGIAAFETLAQRILDAQNADIDDVAGATVTSAGVKTAASEAIAEALGGGAGGSQTRARRLYGRSRRLFSGRKVPVTVTVDENSIVSIDASEDCAETTIMLRTVKELLIPRIIEAQSVGVDAICGATATSNAIKSGVADCLAQALEAAGSPQSALANFYTVPEKAHAGEEVSLEADVLVVGLGGAGATAAISAAEAGLKVIAVEKAGKVGGTSSIASEPMAINPKRFQEEHNDGKDYIDASVMKEAWLAYTTGADGTRSQGRSRGRDVQQFRRCP